MKNISQSTGSFSPVAHHATELKIQVSNECVRLCSVNLICQSNTGQLFSSIGMFFVHEHWSSVLSDATQSLHCSAGGILCHPGAVPLLKPTICHCYVLNLVEVWKFCIACD